MSPWMSSCRVWCRQTRVIRVSSVSRSEFKLLWVKTSILSSTLSGPRSWRETPVTRWRTSRSWPSRRLSCGTSRERWGLNVNDDKVSTWFLSGNDQGAGGGTETTGPDCRGQEEVGDRGQVSSADIFYQNTAVKDFTFYWTILLQNNIILLLDFDA